VSLLKVPLNELVSCAF